MRFLLLLFCLLPCFSKAQLVTHPDKKFDLSESQQQVVDAFLAGEELEYRSGYTYIELPKDWRSYIEPNPLYPAFQAARFFYVELDGKIQPQIGHTYLDKISKHYYLYRVEEKKVETLTFEIYLIPFASTEEAASQLKILENAGGTIAAEVFEKDFPQAIFTRKLSMAKVDPSYYHYFQLMQNVEEGDYVIFNDLIKEPPYLYCFKVKERKMVEGLQLTSMKVVDENLETEVTCKYCGGKNAKDAKACEYCGAPLKN